MAYREKDSNLEEWYPYFSSGEIEESSGDRYYGSASPWEKKAIDRLLEAIEKIYGIKLNSASSPGLNSYAPDFQKALLAANKLKEVGVIENIRTEKMLSDEPKMYQFFATVQGTHSSGQNGLGSSFFSGAQALWAALGEAIDRYSLINFSPRSYIDTSYERLSNKALDIFSLAGISEEQRKRGHPKASLLFDQKTVFRWTKGYSLTKSKPIWVPLQLVTFYNWPMDREPYLRFPISTGSAAGESLEHALYRGVLEVIERDAFMITWLKRLSPPRIDLKSFQDTHIEKIREYFERYHLDLTILALPTDVPCHTILAIIVDRRPGFAHLTIGLRASLNLKEAVIGAVQEALGGRIFARNHLAELAHNLPEITDTDKIDRIERVALWASRPELKDSVSFLWDGKITSSSELKHFDEPAGYGERLNYLINHFKHVGTEVAYVESLPTTIAGKVPFNCIYALIPEFQPMHLIESLPYFSGQRLESVPKKLGFHTDSSINKIPHPFP